MLPRKIAPLPRWLRIASMVRSKALTSTGLGKLVTLHKKVRNKGGSLSLHNVNPLVYELFEVTRLNTLLDIRRHDRGAGPTEMSLGLPHPAL